MELLVAPIPVIALVGLIVITEHARLIHDIRQTVLEGMRRARQGMRQAPQNQLRELVLGRDDPLTEQLCAFNVGDNDNRNPWASNAAPVSCGWISVFSKPAASITGREQRTPPSR